MGIDGSNICSEDAEKRRFAMRSVKSGLPNDGMVTTIVVLPVLQNRMVQNALEHIMSLSNANGRTRPQEMADALIALVDAYAKGTVTGGREQPSIIVTITAESMTGESNEPGVTPHGDRIPAHIVRRMAENATLQRMLIDAEGIILDLGRGVRYATIQQYKALLVRDGCCTEEGCNIPAAWCDLDHFLPWEEGGETNLENMRLLCRFHHTMRHLKGSWVSGTATDGYIHLPDGTVLHCFSKGTGAGTTGKTGKAGGKGAGNPPDAGAGPRTQAAA